MQVSQLFSTLQPGPLTHDEWEMARAKLNIANPYNFEPIEVRRQLERLAELEELREVVASLQEIDPEDVRRIDIEEFIRHSRPTHTS